MSKKSTSGSTMLCVGHLSEETYSNCVNINPWRIHIRYTSIVPYLGLYYKDRWNIQKIRFSTVGNFLSIGEIAKTLVELAHAHFGITTQCIFFDRGELGWWCNSCCTNIILKKEKSTHEVNGPESYSFCASLVHRLKTKETLPQLPTAGSVISHAKSVDGQT